MMLDLRNNIDAILDKVKPVNQNLQNFKDDILNGKVQLSEEIKSQIMSLLGPFHKLPNGGQ